MRTNIDINEEMVRKAMAMTGIKTKKDVVDQAIREMIERRSRMDLSEIRGKISFADNYDYKQMRGDIVDDIS